MDRGNNWYSERERRRNVLEETSKVFQFQPCSRSDLRITYSDCVISLWLSVRLLAESSVISARILFAPRYDVYSAGLSVISQRRCPILSISVSVVTLIVRGGKMHFPRLLDHAYSRTINVIWPGNLHANHAWASCLGSCSYWPTVHRSCLIRMFLMFELFLKLLRSWHCSISRPCYLSFARYRYR